MLGTGINKMLVDQGFNWNDYANYGRVNVTGVKNGLKIQFDAQTRQNQWIWVNVVSDNTFTIKLGLMANVIVDSNIPAEELSTRLHSAIVANRKVKM